MAFYTAQELANKTGNWGDLVAEQQKEILTYVGRINETGNEWIAEVSDEDGEILFTSSIRVGDAQMTVTDRRDNSVKRHPISMCNSLEEIQADMQKLGYLSEYQELSYGGVIRAGDEDEDYDDEEVGFSCCECGSY